MEGGYNEWLMAGIMGQTIAFASFVVAIGLTADIDKGIVDRMRSLPIHTSSVLVGRSLSSLIHSSIGIFVMSLTGLVIGWRIRGSFAEAVLGYFLLLLWGFAMIWVGILVGSVPALGGGGPGSDVHRDLPADLPGQHLRAHREHADRAAHDRRVEPDLRPRPGRPRALAQRAARARPTPPGRCRTRCSRP